MTRLKKGCVASAAALLALAAALRADDQQLPLRVWLFRLPGTELGLDLADADGDGREDLIAAHMKAPQGLERQVSIYVQGQPAHRFSDQPRHVVEVPPDACAFAAGDFVGGPGAELAFLCPGRLLLLGPEGRPVYDQPLAGFFDYPENVALPRWDLARDLDGDGRPELLVPTKEGYRVMGRGPGGELAARGDVAIPVENRFGASLETQLLNRFLTASSRLRRVVVVDLDQDGRKDLVAYRSGGLARYLQRPDGSFPARPDSEAPLRQVEEALQRAGDKKGEGAIESVRLELHDVDGDGAAELFLTRTVGEMGVFETMRTQHVVFRGRKGGAWDENNPEAVLNLKGLSGDPELIDWDGDGRRDLVVSSYRMDLFTNVKRAITESMTISTMIYRQRADGPLYPEDPDFTLDVDVPLDALEKRGGTQPVSFAADVDGDGVRDLVRRRPEGGLEVRLGSFRGGELAFSDRPVSVAVARCEPPWPRDLDGDGSDELILEPFGGDGLEARTVRLVGLAR